MAANARSIVGTIAVVATLLAGLGTFAAAQLTDEPGLMIGAAVSVAAAAVAVAFSLSSLVTREKPLAIGNLDEVRTWYSKRLKAGSAAAIGGVALIVAIAVAGATSVAGLVLGAVDRDPEAQMSLTVAEHRDGATVQVAADLENVESDSIVELTLRDDSGEIVRAMVRPNSAGLASVKQEVKVVKADAKFTLEAQVMEGSKQIESFILTE
jgi:hypothetical protein